MKPFSALMGLTCQAAQRYLDDNAKFFAKIAFQIEHIQNGGDAI